MLTVASFEDAKDLSVTSVGQTLLTYVQRCFSLNEDTMPCTVDEQFVIINQTIAQRIVKGIHLMYGIEFAWEVVAVDMCCLRLAMRIITARRALAPFAPTTTIPPGPQFLPITDNGVQSQAA